MEENFRNEDPRRPVFTQFTVHLPGPPSGYGSGGPFTCEVWTWHCPSESRTFARRSSGSIYVGVKVNSESHVE